jgi:hypothetical protein
VLLVAEQVTTPMCAKCLSHVGAVECGAGACNAVLELPPPASACWSPKQLPDAPRVLQETLQKVLGDYHNLKESTILNAESVINEQVRHYESALEAKERVAKQWQAEAKRNASLANVNCVADFQAEVAQLKVCFPPRPRQLPHSTC